MRRLLLAISLLFLAGAAQAQSEFIKGPCFGHQIASGACAPNRLGQQVLVLNADSELDEDCAVNSVGASTLALCSWNGAAWVGTPPGHQGLNYFLDETLNPPAAGSNGGTDAAQRLGSIPYFISRLQRDQNPPDNIYSMWNVTYDDSHGDSHSQGTKWPYLEFGGSCPVGAPSTWPNCNTTKNNNGATYETHFKLDESQGQIWSKRLYCSGPGDCIGENMDVFALSPAPANGDEGTFAHRYLISDVMPSQPTGVTQAQLVGGATSIMTSIAPGNFGVIAINTIGKFGLMVFDGGANTSILDGAAGAAGLINYDNARRTWQVAQAGDLPANLAVHDTTTHNTGYCFAYDEAARPLYNGVGSIDSWLLITHGPGDADGCCTNETAHTGCGCAADEFETYSPNSGSNDGAPGEYVPGEIWDTFTTGSGTHDGKVAACEQIKSVDFTITANGLPASAGSYTVRFAATKTGRNIANASAWEYYPLRAGAATGVRVVFENNWPQPYAFYVTNSSAHPNTNGTVFASFFSGLFPSTNPTRASVNYGFLSSQPTQYGAFAARPGDHATGWSEFSPTVFTEVNSTDYGTAAADQVNTQSVMSRTANPVGLSNFFWKEMVDTVSTRIVHYWSTGVGTLVKTQVATVGATYPLSYYTVAGTNCNTVCTAAKMGCNKQLDIDVAGAIQVAANCTVNAANKGAFCECLPAAFP